MNASGCSVKTPQLGRFLRSIGACVFCAALLPGCQSVLPAFGPLGDAIHHAVHGSEPKGQFLPGFEYLLMDLEDRQAVMVLGTRRTTATPSGEVVDEYWYSGNREMLHLRDGRIQTLLGATTEWRETRGQPPQWASLQPGQPPTPWLRERDEMPHYRYGIQDRIDTQVMTEPPPDGGKHPALRWIQDDIQTTTREGQPWAFQQRFALQNHRVVYSEQCISPALCLRLTHKP